jgi:hypothetical protein
MTVFVELALVFYVQRLHYIPPTRIYNNKFWEELIRLLSYI